MKLPEGFADYFCMTRQEELVEEVITCIEDVEGFILAKSNREIVLLVIEYTDYLQKQSERVLEESFVFFKALNERL